MPRIALPSDWLFLAVAYVFCIVMPLVWVRLFGTSIAPYHVMAVFLMGIVPFLPGGMDAAKRLFSTGKIFWLSSALVVAAMAVSFMRSTWVYEPFSFLKFTAFVGTAFASAVLFFLIIRRGLLAWLALAPVVASILFVAFISIEFTAAGIDPVALFNQAIERREPNIVINQMFRATFAATNEGLVVRANLKQSLAFAFLLFVPLGIVALQFVPRRLLALRLLSMSGIAFSVIVAVIQFSRAAWVALFLMGVCYLLSRVRTTIGLVVTFAGLLIGVPAIVLAVRDTGFVALLAARATSEASVTNRISSSAEHWEAIGRSPWLGSQEIMEKWAHNVMIDAWSAFGILGLVGASMFFVALLLFIGRGILQSLASGIGSRGVHMAIAALCCPAIVRMMTAPNVTIDFPTWVGIGMAVAIAADAWKSPAPTGAGQDWRLATGGGTIRSVPAAS